MANESYKISGDYRVVINPELHEYNGLDVCIFHVVDIDTDTTGWSKNDILTKSKRVYECGGHAKHSERYLEVDSICNITGTRGKKEAIDLNGEKYTQECINSTSTQFLSYPISMIVNSSQNLFDSL